METVKLMVAAFLSPLLISLTLQLTGWLLLLRHRRAGLLFVAAGSLILAVGSLAGFTFSARQATEWSFRPADADQAKGDDNQPLAIVVAGTGFRNDPELPVTCQVSGTFLARFLEGVRLQKALAESRLVVSVAGDAPPADKRSFLNEICRVVGINAGDVEIITDAESTFDEAQFVAKRYPDLPIMVVTSAGHMPRAIQIFQDQQLTVIPAPAEFYLPRPGSPDNAAWRRWIPSTDGVNGNHQWLYEKAATGWHLVTGR